MLKQYIKDNWDSCIRFSPKNDGTLIGLPKPYIVPSPADCFQEMYYWDTFFTCKGLILSGRAEVARDCCEDMMFLIEKYGFMPNGSRTFYLTRSQPPFLSMMVMDVYNVYKDKEWLKMAYETLKKEYKFWMTQRITEIGLNQYGCDMNDEIDVDENYNYTCSRLEYEAPTDDKYRFARNFIADCESGWDFNPRTEMQQDQYIYVDLNSNLYIYEKNFAEMSEILGTGETEKWNTAAENRRELMNKYLWNGEMFTDYNFVQKHFSPVFSVASFYPLWAGVATAEQAKTTVAKLSALENEYGISTCEKNESPATYQWDWPNGWAPLHYITVRALDRFGFTEDAKRIAEKYTKTTEALFDETGKLWEKFNTLTGKNDTKGYASNIMLGWTAGVYLYLMNYLGK